MKNIKLNNIGEITGDFDQISIWDWKQVLQKKIVGQPLIEKFENWCILAIQTMEQFPTQLADFMIALQQHPALNNSSNDRTPFGKAIDSIIKASDSKNREILIKNLYDPEPEQQTPKNTTPTSDSSSFKPKLK